VGVVEDSLDKEIEETIAGDSTFCSFTASSNHRDVQRPVL
jgi:hypothetical protein